MAVLVLKLLLVVAVQGMASAPPSYRRDSPPKTPLGMPSPNVIISQAKLYKKELVDDTYPQRHLSFPR